jgi:hypothetical protein
VIYSSVLLLPGVADEELRLFVFGPDLDEWASLCATVRVGLIQGARRTCFRAANFATRL